MKTFACFRILVLFGFPLSLRAAVRVERREAGPGGEGSECVDGTYRHGTSACCLCAAGQRLEEHCTAASPHDGRCRLCEPNTYRSSPNRQRTCEPCTSCSHPNANLEVDSACTRASDTKCRCKAHHYCISGGDQGCKLCSPCAECGTEGVKVACTAANNSVCHDKLEARGHLWAGLAFGAVVLTVGVLWCCIKSKPWSNTQKPTSAPNSKTSDTALALSFKSMDPLPYLPDIAEVLGWKTMSNVAMRCGMNPVIIEACKLDHPNDSQEQVLQLLNRWTEEQGKDAIENLAQTLEAIKQRNKAQKVRDILSNV